MLKKSGVRRGVLVYKGPDPAGKMEIPVKSFLLAFFFLMVLSYPLRDRDLIPSTPIVEDGFYSLTVSRHLAQGHGMSYDGVTPTNGVQPLSVILSAPIFWFFPHEQRYLPLRAIILLQISCFIAASFLCGKVAESLLISSEATKWVRWSGVGLWAFSVAVFRHSVNGLETGYYLLSMLAFLSWLIRQGSSVWTTRKSLTTGVLLGLIVLMRIDAVFLVFGTCLWLLFFRDEDPRRRLINSTVVATVALLVSLPWWYRNVAVFGNVIPTSGLAQAIDIVPSSNMARLPNSLAQPLIPIFPPYAWRYFLPFSLIWFLLIGAGWWWIAHEVRIRSLLKDASVLFPFVFQMTCLTYYYTFNFGAGYFLERYLIPWAVPVIPVTGLLLGSYFDVIAKKNSLRLVALTGCAVVALVASSEHLFMITSSARLSGNPLYESQYLKLAANLPAEAVISGLQSGTLGYFRPGAINLDGKVNIQALKARRANELWRYVLSKKIDYVIDLPPWVDVALGPLAKNGCFELRGQHDGVQLWKRVIGTEQCFSVDR